MNALAILIADDDADVCRAAGLALHTVAAQVHIAASLDDMTAHLGRQSFDCVLLDMNFALGDRSGRDGLDGLARIKAADPTLAVVLMTAYGAVSVAVEALKRGGADFLLKPWRNDALVASMRAAAQRTAHQRADEPLALDGLERSAIAKALTRHEGNIAQAAATLGLSRPALYRRMNKYGF